MNTSAITVHLEITGRVQGVGFRDSMRTVALALRIRGWVRNRANGSVEAMVQGDAADVEHLIAWCHNGPPGAQVRFVKATAVDESPPLAGFLRV